MRSFKLMSFFIVMLGLPLNAQDIPQVNINVYSLYSEASTGADHALLVEYTIPEGTHLTENFLEITLDENQPFEGGLLQISDGSYEKGEIVRRGTAYFKLSLIPETDLLKGKYTIKGQASYQLCTEGETMTCYPPQWKDYSVELKINPDSIIANKHAEEINKQFKISSENTVVTLESRLQNALSKGSFFALFIVFLGGFLTSLTPCVYPMIPITIGYIGGRSAGQGKMRGFILSLFFVLGLAIIYSILGIFAALTGSLFGSITQTPFVLAIVAFIFVLMGISMLGFFDIALPASFTSRLQSGGPRKGFIGAIAMGMVSGLVAAPCAGPVIVVLMAYIATTRNILIGFSLMMSFALGMGLLFIAIGTFSGLVSSLPQAGGWMDKIKKIFGVILLAAAIWIIHPIIPPFVFGIIVGLGCIVLGTAMGAFDPIVNGTTSLKRYGKATGITLIAIGIYWVVNLVPIPGKVIPDISSLDSNVESTLNWQTDIDDALRAAKSANQNLLLDFTADWCAACQELEHKTFRDANVQKILENFVLTRIDSTNSRDPEIKKIHSKYNVKGLPTVLILDPDGNELSRFVSFIPANQFLSFIKEATS